MIKKRIVLCCLERKVRGLRSVSVICLALLLCLPAGLIGGGRDLGLPGDSAVHRGPVDPFAPGYEVISYDKSTGDLTLKFTITYFPGALFPPTCDQLMMLMYPFDGLVYTGPDTLLVPYQTRDTFSTLWDLNLPPNDSSYLVFRQECDRVGLHYGLRFVTTGDTLVINWGTGEHHRSIETEWTVRHWGDRLEEYERAKREWEERQQSRNGRGRMAVPVKPGDSAFFESLSDYDKRLYGRMLQLEREPLTDGRSQEFWIGGKCFKRRKGEYEFKETKLETQEETRARHHRYWDSLAANPPNNVYHLILDLREPHDYEYAVSLIDSLSPTEEQGNFRVDINRDVYKKLLEKGIKVQRADRMPIPDRDTTGTPQKKKPSTKPEGKAAGDRSEQLFFEGFEYVWPGQWQVGDDDSRNGPDFWGDLYNTVPHPERQRRVGLSVPYSVLWEHS